MVRGKNFAARIYYGLAAGVYLQTFLFDFYYCWLQANVAVTPIIDEIPAGSP